MNFQAVLKLASIIFILDEISALPVQVGEESDTDSEKSEKPSPNDSNTTQDTNTNADDGTRQTNTKDVVIKHEDAPKLTKSLADEFGYEKQVASASNYPPTVTSSSNAEQEQTNKMKFQYTPKGVITEGQSQPMPGKKMLAVNKMKTPKKGSNVRTSASTTNHDHERVSFSSDSDQRQPIYYATDDESSISDDFESMLKIAESAANAAASHRHQPQKPKSRFYHLKNKNNEDQVNQLDLLLQISKEQSEIKKLLTEMSIRQGNMEDVVFHIAKQFPGSDTNY